MNRLERCFADLKQAGRKGLVGFLTAGDPDPDTSLEIMTAACASGLDVLELGVPFSDPTVDGPVIQAATARALESGTTLSGVLDLARRLRARTETPLVLFSYINPILQYGPRRLHDDAVAAGVDGMLIVDLPPEESCELIDSWPEKHLPLIRLLAPTTPPERIRMIVGDAGGFLYMITRAGVTGEGSLDVGNIALHAAELRDMTELPIALGFGIRRPEDAAALAPMADAVVVGSALVARVAEGGAPAEIAARVAADIRALKKAL